MSGSHRHRRHQLDHDANIATTRIYDRPKMKPEDSPTLRSAIADGAGRRASMYGVMQWQRKITDQHRNRCYIGSSRVKSRRLH